MMQSKKIGADSPPKALLGPSYSRVVNRSPVFYGWVILVAGSIGMIMTSPGQTYAVSIFIDSFIADLGISRSVVSTLYSMGTLVGSFALPFVGRQIDHRGGRMIVVIISVLFGIACIYMGIIQNALMLGLGFIAIRMLGQGSLGLVCTNVINQWWVRRRGMAMGISGVLMSLLALGGFPNLIYWLISQYGWRVSYGLLGMTLILFMAPLGYLFFRDRPEEYGLQPDGAKTTTTTNENISPSTIEENWTLAEAIRTRSFWIVSLGLGVISMLGTGLFFHMVSILNDGGLTAAEAASVFVPIAVTTAVVNLGSGILIDRVRIRVILAAALLTLAISLWMAPRFQGLEWAFLYGIVLGSMSGLQRTASTVVWAAYFGRRHLGSITGLSSTILVAASALGPMPFGIARDVLGSYTVVLTVCAIAPLILAGASLLTGRPNKR
jgi:sugar phosphate permease